MVFPSLYAEFTRIREQWAGPIVLASFKKDRGPSDMYHLEVLELLAKAIERATNMGLMLRAMNHDLQSFLSFETESREMLIDEVAEDLSRLSAELFSATKDLADCPVSKRNNALIDALRQYGLFRTTSVR